MTNTVDDITAEAINQALRSVSLPNAAYWFDVRLRRDKPIEASSGKHATIMIFEIALIKWHNEAQVAQWISEASAE